MSRVFSAAVAVAATALFTARADAQTPHTHPAGGDHAHSHASAPVDCNTLASPPWTGLSERDREQISLLQRSVAHLNTPEAAQAAGFRPLLGNIPGMGVHYVHSGNSRNGVRVGEPDHLLFAPVDGEERLVGAAYAFQDVVATTVPLPFESELAAWHDHPEFAGGDQTLHMLHVWFVPSSNGPFAGLNFFLPFHGAGIQPPNACWMAEESDAERIQQVAFSLAATSPNGSAFGLLSALRGAAGRRSDGPSQQDRERAEALSAMDNAARLENRQAWNVAADRYLATLTPAERMLTNRLLQGLTNAQMSTPEREAARDHSGH